jgi:hypothetical protein
MLLLCLDFDKNKNALFSIRTVFMDILGAFVIITSIYELGPSRLCVRKNTYFI